MKVILDVQSGEYRRVNLQQPRDFTHVEDGLCEFLAGQLVAVYVQRQKLFIYFKNCIYEMNDSLVVEWSRSAKWRRLKVLATDSRESVLHYKTRHELILFDFTQIEEEDLDFGLYLFNLSRRPDRQSVFLELRRNKS